MKKIMFVECDNCNNEGIINNNTYLNNKDNLDNIKCWNCEEIHVVDEDYIHDFFNDNYQFEEGFVYKKNDYTKQKS